MCVVVRDVIILGMKHMKNLAMVVTPGKNDAKNTASVIGVLRR
jgi:hypothetical protein